MRPLGIFLGMAMAAVGGAVALDFGPWTLYAGLIGGVALIMWATR